MLECWPDSQLTRQNCFSKEGKSTVDDDAVGHGCKTGDTGRKGDFPSEGKVEVLRKSIGWFWGGYVFSSILL